MKKIMLNTPNNLSIIKTLCSELPIVPYKVGLCKRDGSIGNRCNMDLIGVTETGLFIVKYVSRGKSETMNCNRLTIEV